MRKQYSCVTYKCITSSKQIKCMRLTVSSKQVLGKLCIIILTEWIAFTVEGVLLLVNVPRLQVRSLVGSLIGALYSSTSQTCLFLTITPIHLLHFIRFELFNTSSCQLYVVTTTLFTNSLMKKPAQAAKRWDNKLLETITDCMDYTYVVSICNKLLLCGNQILLQIQIK